MKKTLLLIVLLCAGLVVFSGCTAESAKLDDEIIFEVVDRRAEEVVSYVHVDYWHGGLPDLAIGGDCALEANIKDENGEEVVLDYDKYSLGVDYAEGADESVVSLELHNDHVHIIGDEEGATEVVFQLLQDGHVDYETPPIAVNVVSN